MARPAIDPHDNGELWQSTLLVRYLGHDETSLARAAPPEPDTVLALPTGPIGIEVTQLSPGGQEGRRVEGTREQVLRETARVCDARNVPPFLAHVDWAQGFFPSQAQRQAITDGLAQLAEKHCPKPMESVVLDQVIDANLVLPPGVNMIKLTGLPDKPGGWFSLGYGFPPDVSEDMVREAVARKASKPANYRTNYAEIWLLLVLGAGGVSTWGRIVDALKSISVATPYDRVFVFSPLELAMVEVARLPVP